jgi:large conductance mechanosensitive channel
MTKAIGKIVRSLVNDILMPPLGLFLGKIDFSNLFINLSRGPVSSVSVAKAQGLATINYRVFVNTVLDFIVAFIALLLICEANRLRRPKPAEALIAKQCPYCYLGVNIKVTRCL